MALDVKDVIGVGSVIAAFMFAVMALIVILEPETAPPLDLRRTGRAWPVGIALSAAAVSWRCLVGGSFGLQRLGSAAVRGSDCEGKTTGAELWSWIVFADSVALSLGVTFILATRLRIARLGAIALTVIAMSPLIAIFAVLLGIVNTQPFCSD